MDNKNFLLNPSDLENKTIKKVFSLQDGFCLLTTDNMYFIFDLDFKEAISPKLLSIEEQVSIGYISRDEYIDLVAKKNLKMRM